MKDKRFEYRWFDGRSIGILITFNERNWLRRNLLRIKANILTFFTYPFIEFIIKD